MATMNTRAASLVAAGVAVAALGLGASQMARAEDTGASTPTATATGDAGSGRSITAPGAPGAAGNGKGWGPGGRHGGPGMGLGKGLRGDLSALATKLGVTETTLHDALTAVRGDLKAARQGAAKPSMKPDRATMQGELATKLAARLGIDAAKVTTAMAELRSSHDADERRAFDDRLAAAVTAGTLTQAESDAVKKAATAGVIDMHGGPR